MIKKSISIFKLKHLFDIFFLTNKLLNVNTQISFLIQRSTVPCTAVQVFNSKSKSLWKEHYLKKFLILISLITYLNQSQIHATENQFFKQYFESHFNDLNQTIINSCANASPNLIGCNCVSGNGIYCIGSGSTLISNTTIPAVLNGGVIYVEGNLIINRTQQFNGTQVYYAPFASLTIISSGNLFCTTNTFHDACGLPGSSRLMWKGIVVQNGGSLKLNGTTISNAYEGVELQGGFIRQLTNSTFNRCYIGVAMPNGGKTINVNFGNNFYCTENLLPGYLQASVGTRTWAGIWIHGGAMTMTGLNTYIGCYNGIIAEDANVVFRNQNIQPIGNFRFDYRVNTDFRLLQGYGIICSNSSTMNIENNHLIGHARTGILVLKSSGKISKNIFNVGYCGAHILNCANQNLLIDHNIVNFASYGILVEESDKLNRLRLQKNILNAGSTNLGILRNVGIQLVGKEGMGSSALIDSNEISIEKNGDGIYITHYTMCDLIINTITVRQPFEGSIFVNTEHNAGIYIEGGSSHYLLSNTITTAGSIGNKKLSGIILVGADNSKFCCNTTNGTYYGISLIGDGLKQLIGSNTMLNNYNASLHVDKFTQTGFQFHRANLWPNISPPGIEAEHEGEERDIDNSIFYIKDFNNTQYLPDPIYTPNTATPWPWFIDEPGFEELNCIVCQIERNNQFFFDGGGATLDEIDSKIADDDSDFGYYDEGRQWNLQIKLLNMLQSFPFLLGQDSGIDSFYNNSINQALGLFYQIRQNVNGIHNISFSDQATLNSLQGIISINLDELVSNSTLIDQVGIDNEAIYILMDSIQLDLLALHTQYQTLLDQIRNHQVLTALSILNSLDSLQASSATQELEKRINQLALKYFVYGISGISLSEWQEISNIANSCLHAQRFAVLSARGLYQSYSDTIINIEDNCNIAQPIISESKEIKAPANIQVYQYPSQSHWIIQWDGQNQLTSIKVFTLDGKEVKIKILPINESRSEIMISNEPTGIYYLQLSLQSGRVISNRINVIH